MSTPPTAPWNEHAGRRFSLSATVLEARDAHALADFYRRLLGWTVLADEPGSVMLRPPGGGSGLSFSSDPAFVEPVWPATRDHNQMQLHLDIRVDDLAAGVAHALATGARLAELQPQDDVRVLLDPAGHPFCFFES
jgi:catechol 2,3-dioxygenase-like lactoylglutathione lyase family enzyme